MTIERVRSRSGDVEFDDEIWSDDLLKNGCSI